MSQQKVKQKNQPKPKNSFANYIESQLIPTISCWYCGDFSL